MAGRKVRRFKWSVTRPGVDGHTPLCEADRPTAMPQKCPQCGTRRARRACPALGQSICAVCCGTKRVVEISCPSDCTYLVTAQSHPPATVQRQRERDLGFLIPLLHGMTERQHQLTWLVQSFLRRDRPDAPDLGDDDVEQAVRALAETYETASRGIIYEHRAGHPSAERLSEEIRTLVESQRTEGLQVGDADVAQVLRRIEAGARDARTALPGDKSAYLGLLKRVLRDAPGTNETGKGPAPAGGGGTGLIVPSR